MKHTPPVDVVEAVTPVWVDKDFTEAERVDIHTALDEWTYAMNGYSSFRTASDSFDMEPEVLEIVDFTGQGLIILRRSVTSPAVAELPDGVLAWADDAPGHVINVIGDRTGTRDLHSIMLHEIGHILGLEHVMVKHSLMWPSYNNGAACVDRVTAMALGSVRGWDWHHMNWCDRPL